MAIRIISRQDSRYVGLGLGKRGDAPVFLDIPLAGIISRKGLGHVAPKLSQQSPQILGRTVKALGWIKWIVDSKPLGRGGDELRQTLRSRGGDSLGVAAGFHMHHCCEQGPIEVMALGCLLDERAEFSHPGLRFVA